ncbi:MAG: acetylglutamate kinase [Anaerolineae bacterium]|nr:acetylglutamate kinase [Anaerolineae bacterium]
MDTLVLKVGGNEIEDEKFLKALTRAVTVLRRSMYVIIVHGGGRKIAQLQERLGLETRFLEGLRVTDQESLQVAEMVLSGTTNKRLTARLVAAGIPTMGLSGVDWGLLRAERLVHPAGDLGMVGRIVSVHTEALETLLKHGLVPVISPISLGLDGKTYNVNADHAATAIAAAAGASALVFLSNVPGVLIGNRAAPLLTSTRIESLIANNEINGGMIPKVRSALEALAGGVSEVRITNLKGLLNGGGTRVIDA